MTPFAYKVRAAVRAIPPGHTQTYAQVAAAAGHPGAARAVGRVMRWNFDPSIPCHRVVRAGGRPTPYNQTWCRGTRADLLAAERGQPPLPLSAPTDVTVS